jgi:hypothetical protein
MIGEAGLVLIERAKFPGLPRRRGERGPSKASEHNLSIAREAVCLIAAGETQRAAVAKLFMQVKANSEPAQKAELRRLIKVASKNAD